MKGQLIIGKHYSFYNINNNLIKVIIRGNNNNIINPHKIIDLYINGNHNNIEIVRGGRINNIRVYGNHNTIAIKNNSHVNFFDQGINNKIFKSNDNNNIPFQMSTRVPIFFNNNNFNRVLHPIYPPIFNDHDIEVDNILNKLEEHNYFYLPQELKYFLVRNIYFIMLVLKNISKIKLVILNVQNATKVLMLMISQVMIWILLFLLILMPHP